MSAGGLLKSMAMIGGAQSITILMGILRVKVVAVLLGPAGVGILGIYGNILQTGAQLAGLGVGQSGVRQIAAARADAGTLAQVRRTLLLANLVQGAAGMAAVWLLRRPISSLVFGDETRAFEVGLLGVGVFASLLAASQTALLQGMRRIPELARIAIEGGAVGTAAGLLAVWLWGEPAIIILPLAAPVASVLAALRHTRRLPRPEPAPFDAAQTLDHWRQMLGLGVVFMSGGLLSGLALLAVRASLTRDFGVDAAGHFQASWAITMQYVGFLLSAMGADYYPRLAAIINDRPAAARLVNEQTAIALSLVGPAMAALIGLAPWVVTALYSARFGPAVELLQWQTLGNVLKLSAWPLGYVIVAHARSGLFFASQLAFNAVFVGFVALATPIMGLNGAGVAFVAAYCVHLALMRRLVGRLHDFRWERDAVRLLAMNLALGASVLLAARLDPLAGAAAGLAAAAVAAVAGARTIARRIGPNGRLGAKLHRIFQRIGWPVARQGDDR
ncbi:O-antigen translocase [Oceanicella actignis]|uniref:O-antigen translocase n=1 Tax=Oceanicella actignis TaxID=1189325 RepID=UPI0011E61814|nr:O-antigen translocase [Oceanicella actignis]TYO88781.1 PST family polysaccharide transporter [Oceanicella actignis]